MTLDSEGWLRFASRQLGTHDQPSLEAALLLAAVLKKPRAHILAHLDELLSATQLLELNRLLERLSAGEPLAYLSGAREFFGLELIVSPAVLVPRPETELLVETALAWLRAHPGRRRAVDVGTGSGCIATALACNLPDLTVLALDRSWEALQVAGQNFSRLGVSDRVARVQADLLRCAAARFDLVCANLPYIPSASLQSLAVSAYEPWLALDGGPDGLGLIQRLLADSPRWLAPGGLLLLEIEAGQGDSVPALARGQFPAAVVELKHDLAGLPRLVSVEREAG